MGTKPINLGSKSRLQGIYDREGRGGDKGCALTHETQEAVIIDALESTQSRLQKASEARFPGLHSLVTDFTESLRGEHLSNKSCMSLVLSLGSNLKHIFKQLPVDHRLVSFKVKCYSVYILFF